MKQGAPISPQAGRIAAYLLALAVLASTAVILINSLARESSVAVYVEPERKDDQGIFSSEKPPATLLFIGDVMLGRHVETLMNKNGPGYPFAVIDPLLKSVDAVVANLEGPIRASHTQTPSAAMRFSFASTTAPLLAAHNISIASLANNHTYDFGAAGFKETAAYLRAADVAPVGNPFDIGEQYALKKEISGQKFIFAAFNATSPSFNFTKARAHIAELRQSAPGFLVVLVHGGEEYKLASNEEQRTFYRGLVDSGADLVVGHHPHVVEEFEVYRDKAIFYSLGNFIFDQYFSEDVEKGLAVKMTLASSMVSYEVIPLESDRSQPKIAASGQKPETINLPR